MCGNIQVIPEFSEKFHKGLKFFLVGCIMDPVYKCFHLLLASFSPNKLGYFPVCQEHEIFDQFIGVLIFPYINTNRIAFFVKLEFYFLGLKIYCTVSESVFP